VLHGLGFKPLTYKILGVVKQIAMTMTVMKCFYIPSLSWSISVANLFKSWQNHFCTTIYDFCHYDKKFYYPNHVPMINLLPFAL
jgi:hypothetical protein